MIDSEPADMAKREEAKAGLHALAKDMPNCARPLVAPRDEESGALSLRRIMLTEYAKLADLAKVKTTPRPNHKRIFV